LRAGLALLRLWLSFKPPLLALQLLHPFLLALLLRLWLSFKLPLLALLLPFLLPRLLQSLLPPLSVAALAAFGSVRKPGRPDTASKAD
jgi:hypothetical protein